MLDFSFWLRNGSNPADINRFQSHTGISISPCNNFLSAKYGGGIHAHAAQKVDGLSRGQDPLAPGQGDEPWDHGLTDYVLVMP